MLYNKKLLLLLLFCVFVECDIVLFFLNFSILISFFAESDLLKSFTSTFDAKLKSLLNASHLLEEEDKNMFQNPHNVEHSLSKVSNVANSFVFTYRKNHLL